MVVARFVYLPHQINYSVQMFESTLFQHPWVHVILEMPVVEGYSYTVELQVREELGIFVSEKVFQPFFEEVFVFLFSENFEHGSPVL